MHWNVYVTKLQSVLAQLFPKREDGVLLCQQAGMDISRIDFDEPAYVRWFHICDEAMKQEFFDKLLVVSSAKYPNNRGLNQAMADWSGNRDYGAEFSVAVEDVFHASVVRDLASIDGRVAVIEAAILALAAGREAEIQAGTVSQGLTGVGGVKGG